MLSALRCRPGGTIGAVAAARRLSLADHNWRVVTAHLGPRQSLSQPLPSGVSKSSLPARGRHFAGRRLRDAISPPPRPEHLWRLSPQSLWHREQLAAAGDRPV